MEAFRSYYEKQGILTPSLLSTLYKELPVVIRINKNRESFDKVHNKVSQCSDWTPLTWFPEPTVFQCDPTSFLENRNLKKWLSDQNKSYTIRFQEAVSLLPPLLLDLSSSTALSILDLCAAPGSKTLECMELLTRHKQTNYCLIANEADSKRCQRLLPMILRRGYSTGVIVTLGDARKFPSAFTHSKHMENSNPEQFLFDRILADVPCSGDGTIRKNANIQNTWSVSFALTLHSKQLDILLRGLHLLNEGGILVYSTCSLNPLENEAVVSSALSVFGDSIQLLPARSRLDGVIQGNFDSSPGLDRWFVPCENEEQMEYFAVWEDVPNHLRRLEGGKITETMFPTGRDHIKNCMRVYPQQNNTGGFFIAVFKKAHHKRFETDDFPEIPKTASISWRGRNEKNTWEVMEQSDPIWEEIAMFYGIKELPDDVYLLREYNIKGNCKIISLVSKKLLEFLHSKIQGKKKGQQIIFAGLPLVKRMDENFLPVCSCRWRPTLESGNLLSKQMSMRVLLMEKESLVVFLKRKRITVKELRDLTLANKLDGLHSCEEKVGPVLVGLLNSSDNSDIWIPAVITGKQMLLFGRSSELEHIFVQLE